MNNLPDISYIFAPQQIFIKNKISELLSNFKLVDNRLNVEISNTDELYIHFHTAEFINGLHIFIANYDELGCKNYNIALFNYYKYNSFNEIINIPLIKNNIIKINNGINLSKKIKLIIKNNNNSHEVVQVSIKFNIDPKFLANKFRYLNDNGKLYHYTNVVRFYDFNEDIIESNVFYNLIENSTSDEVPKIPLFINIHDTNNILGQPIQAGITMYVCVKDRNSNIEKNLKNWLDLPIDELIIIDWSSSTPVSEIHNIFLDPRVRLIRVNHQHFYIRTWAQNLAIKFARYNQVFKCDSDVTLAADFFSWHQLEVGSFYVGDWHQARDFNERHLTGMTFSFLEDLKRVNGYDERIITYGEDDTNLKDRMILSGLHKQVFNYDLISHQAHEQSIRAHNQKNIHPMVSTFNNKMLCSRSKFWSNQESAQKFTINEFDPQVYEVNYSNVINQLNLDYEEEAINHVCSWYVSKDRMNNMTLQDKVNIIWERQIE